jgi:hypothetical protein
MATPGWLVWIQIVALAGSALAWLAASILSTPLPAAYVSGAPAKVVKRIRLQSGLNAVAAFLAAVGVGIQAYVAWAIPISN